MRILPPGWRLGVVGLGVAVVITPVASAGAVECYRAGNDALDAGRHADAARAFEVAADLPACAASRAGLLHSKAIALHAMARAGGEPALACRAAEAYRLVIGLEPTSRVGRASVDALADADARCTPGAPEPQGTDPAPGSAAADPVPDHTLAWGLTIGAGVSAAAGGILLALAVDAEDDRDAADRRALAAEPGSAAETAALDDFAAASDRTDAFGISAYALLGLGGALAVGSIIAWAVDDTPTVSLAPAPTGVVLIGRW